MAHLRLLRFPLTSRRNVVDILIVVDAIDLHSPVEGLHGSLEEPVARRMPLGWMFVPPCQKNVTSLETNSQRKLSRNDKPDFYEFQRLVFGDKASPCLTQMVRQEHATKNATKFLDVAKTVWDSMYMDGNLDSVASVGEAITLRRNLTKMMLSLG